MILVAKDYRIREDLNMRPCSTLIGRMSDALSTVGGDVADIIASIQIDCSCRVTIVVAACARYLPTPG